MNRGRASACLIALLALGACANMPAALEPHGSNAQQTARIAWVLFWGGGLIYAFVIALAAYAVVASPGHRAWLGQQAFVVSAGIVFPIVTLSALLFYTFKVSGELVGTKDAVPLKIEIVGQMWWWRVHYVDTGGASVLVTANEVHVPVGRTVELSLESADVLHSLWVPNLPANST